MSGMNPGFAAYLANKKAAKAAGGAPAPSKAPVHKKAKKAHHHTGHTVNMSGPSKVQKTNQHRVGGY